MPREYSVSKKGLLTEGDFHEDSFFVSVSAFCLILIGIWICFCVRALGAGEWIMVAGEVGFGVG
jgi:hypothetical protein